MFSEVVRIPKERVKYLAGKDIGVKERLENALKVNISVKTGGDILIEGDSLELLNAKNIIKAIGRGFEPRIAELLLKDDYILDIVDITDFTGKSRDALIRIKGRVIGREGKSRERIEKMTGSHVCVYGKTVAIIGPADCAHTARRAVTMLLEGRMHSTVSRFLDRAQNEEKQSVVKGFYT